MLAYVLRMESIDEKLAGRVDRYIEALFARQDPVLTENLKNAGLAGLPSINVSPNEGKPLFLLAKISGASRILEVGTLSGYSTTWLARALPPDGKVITLEVDPKHAEVARKNLRLADGRAVFPHPAFTKTQLAERQWKGSSRLGSQARTHRRAYCVATFSNRSSATCGTDATRFAAPAIRRAGGRAFGRGPACSGGPSPARRD